jgi:ElaB/YqjD/DUF883 family membrane-anchored ribosome-binding protein
MAASNRPNDPALSAAGGPETSAASASSAASGNDIAELRRELSKLSAMVTDMAQNRYSQYREQAADVADDVMSRGYALRDEAYAKAGALEEEMQRTVRDRPLTAVAVAAGIGYLIGLISRSGR